MSVYDALKANVVDKGNTIIRAFGGLFLSLTGATGIRLGFLSECKNAKITQDYKIRKREGYDELFASIAVKKIQGQWNGLINGVFFHLFTCNGKLYKTIAGVNTELGTLTDAPTRFFYFGTKVYVINGYEYKSFDGTNFIDVVGYIPKVAIGTPPTGGGTPYENNNLLTGKKRQTFNADGAATVYTVAETSLTSVDSVYVNGVLKTLTTDYTVNLTTGAITFVVAPTTGQDNVEIYWTKGTGSRSEVYSYTQYIFFGGSNDTRVFLYGDGTNEILFSALANGVPSAEYFPTANTMTAGSDEFSVTSLLKQHDRLIISTKQGSYYATYDFDITNGASFPVYPLNDKIGNIPLGQGQLILNNPFTVTDKVYEWVSTTIRDERNAQNKSDRIQPALDDLDLSTAITFDYEEISEYWLCVGKKVYVYNYGNDTWYYYELFDTPSSFTVIDGVLYMGTTNGQIMKWAQYIDIDAIPIYLTDNGNTINTSVRVGSMDFGINFKRKFLNFGWVGMKPETKSICFVEWESDYDASTEAETISYSLIDFGDIDFEDFSFDVNYNPQPFRVKLKAKKFTFFELILTNESDTETMTILNITLPAIIGGVSK